MRFFWEATGTDGQSDDGYWVVIVKATSAWKARREVRQYLEEIGRSDLKREFTVKKNETGRSRILYSSVQKRRDHVVSS